MISYRIPDGWRVCGESMYARRRIAYTDLPGVFIVFGIWDETDTLLGWDDTVDWARRLELPVAPVLYRGGSLSEARGAWGRQRTPETSQGFVVRRAGRISADDFPLQVVKWVGARHGRWRRRDDFAVNEFA
jgi:RNA ligase-like protein